VGTQPVAATTAEASAEAPNRPSPKRRQARVKVPVPQRGAWLSAVEAAYLFALSLDSIWEPALGAVRPELLAHCPELVALVVRGGVL
jgi:hypothetical protein